MLQLHRRFRRDCAVRLQHAFAHAATHRGVGIPNIDLSAGDVEGPALECRGFRQPRDRMLGRRVGDAVRPGHVRGNRTVVDDPSSTRSLTFHDPHRLLRAEETAVEDCLDDLAPAIERELLERSRRHVHARVVEQDVDPAKRLARPGEERLDRGRLAHVGLTCQDAIRSGSGLADGLLQRVEPSAREDDLEAGREQALGSFPTDAGAGTGHDGNFSEGFHA